MSMELTGLCVDHPFESATALCRRCGLEFCHTCVVYPFGDKKPLCKECAMMIAGIKNHAPRPEMAPRLVRKRARLFDKNRQGAAAAMPQPIVPAIVDTTDDPTGGQDLFAPRPTELVEPVIEAPLEPVYEGAGPPAEEPGQGIAPAVDWSNPFG
ncbi:MAG: hypothetical protein AAGA37_02360 [Actinomycetota bacterium]